MRRLVCIVEGHGDVRAVPVLCARLLQHSGRHGWYVDETPVRLPRSQLVDQRSASPHRPACSAGVARAIELARRRPANAILIVCDADDDCPARWAGSIRSMLPEAVPAAAVMAVREFETWLVLGRADLPESEVRQAERKRDAKKLLRRFEPEYAPTTHQARLVRAIDLDRARSRSPSFAKLARELERLTSQRSGRSPK